MPSTNGVEEEAAVVKAGASKGTSSTQSSKFSKGASSALEDHVFHYGSKGAAYQLSPTSWEKLVNYEMSQHGPDIGNELCKRREITL